ncbi:MAG: ATP-binding protein [Verrucomicrobiales bacterium]|jgi:predicted ATP-dependent endonuclease of OLD family|nr:ATP-binding protein [Verrucomicrobiales bacterium]
MHIDSVTIDNYRTFDNCVISFLDTYTAISGKNNAGKSNLLRVIQSFFVNDIDDEFDPFSEQSNFIDFKSDYPIWKGASGIKNPIKFSITLRIHKNRDEGLFKFVTTFLQEECKEEEFTLVLGQEHLHNSNHVIYSLSFNSKKIDDRFKVEEIHKKIKNTNSLIFHNSITSKNSLTRGSSLSFFGSISPEDKEKIKECKNALFRRLNLVAAKHKEEIRDLLGRLEEKY